jgi:hypothetical protein
MVFVQIAMAAPSAVDPGRGLTVFFTFLMHLQNLLERVFAITTRHEIFESMSGYNECTDTSTQGPFR